jgi:MoxR-like ATPase
LEQEGTYPLPEAQLDRFLFKLVLDLPSLDELHRIVDLTTGAHQERAQKAVHADTIMELKRLAVQVPIAKPVQDYALRLVMNTHPHLDDSPEVTRRLVRYGSSPRGAQAIIQTARVRALMEDRYNVSFEDVRSVCHPSLRHRVFLNYQAVSEGKTSDDVINEIIQATEE